MQGVALVAAGSGSDPRLKTRERQRLRMTKAIGHPPCWRCGGEIDYTAPMWEPNAYDLDEILPRYLGGDPLDPDNVLPAHALCNRSAGGRAGGQRKAAAQLLPAPDPEPRPATSW